MATLLELIHPERPGKQQATQTEEDNRLLADEQWGGRSGRTAIDLVMSKEMMISTLHLLRKNGGITDVDAIACYDRI
eukprot:scaffold253977_cov55-Attheya_sp.AAC.1